MNRKGRFVWRQLDNFNQWSTSLYFVSQKIDQFPRCSLAYDWLFLKNKDDSTFFYVPVVGTPSHLDQLVKELPFKASWGEFFYPLDQGVSIPMELIRNRPNLVKIQSLYQNGPMAIEIMGEFIEIQ